MSVNFMDLCRLCLVKEKVSIPIFEGEGDARQIFVKIAACLPVKVERNDKLPKKICDNCLYKVENVYQFWNTTANSEKQLLQWLGEATKHEATPSASTVLETEELMMKVEAEPEQVSKDVSKEKYPLTKRSEEEESVSEDEEEGGSVSEDSMTDGGDTHEGPNKEEVDSDEDAYGELEPTTFVNVSMACEDQAGPSGVQQPTEDSSQANKLDILSVGQSQAQPSSGSAATTAPSGSQESRSSSKNSNVINSKKPRCKESSFKCNICHSSFKSEVTLAHHQLLHSDSQKGYKCDVCGKLVTTKYRMKLHKLSHNTEASFECNVCNKRFKSSHALHLHMRLHDDSGKVYKCEICSKTLMSKYRLEKHISVYHGGEIPLKCDVCNKFYKTQYDIRAHQIMHSGAFRCRVCGKDNISKSQLEFHEKTHAREKPFMCDVCGKCFRMEVLLRAHLKTHDPALCRYKCDLCAYYTDCYATMEYHKKRHLQQRDHQCNLCGKWFFSNGAVLSHKRIVHCDLGPFLCDACGCTFKSNLSLNRHRKCHASSSEN